MLGLMGEPRRHRSRLIATGALLAITTLALVGCSPVQRAAVRVNEDGTVDFASCVGLSDVIDVQGTTSLRTGPNGSVDDATETRLTFDGAISSLAVGQVITLGGLPEHWDRLDIYVRGSTDSVWTYAEDDQIEIGEWHWNDGPSFPFITSYVPEERCTLVDGEGLPVE
jgi:hypothetical protein